MGQNLEAFKNKLISGTYMKKTEKLRFFKENKNRRKK